MNLVRAAVMVAAFISLFPGAPGYCSAPLPAPGAVRPDSPPPRPPRSPYVCAIKGKIYCSEYGTRYKDAVVIVFDDGHDRYGSHVGDGDGGFVFNVPCGASYVVRLEFAGKSSEVGAVVIPPADGNIARTLELFHPGSMLELVWQIRDGGDLGIDMRVKENSGQTDN